ncbi:MAG: hypothetical protein RMI45_08730, partial [Ignisphaera sp.]|nr:hypothetical protein [Ignisphaera sp.]
MKSTHTKAISTTLLALLIISILPATLLLTKPAQAQGTIEFSSDNLHNHKVIEVKVTIPGLDAAYVTMVLKNAAGEPVPIIDKEGTTISGGVFKAYRVGPGVFYAYIGGNNVDLAANPAYPKVTQDDAIVKLSTAPSPGAVLFVEVLGYGIARSFTFNTVKPAEVKTDRDSVPARRPADFTVRLTVTDQDLNLDPTKVDDLATYSIIIGVTHISGTTGATATKSLTKSGAGIKETAVNSGTFTVSVTTSEITPQNVNLGPGDIFLLSIASDVGVLGDSDKTVTTKLSVAYRYPEISIDFNQQGIVVLIRSPDDNVNTGAKDCLDPNEMVYIIYGGTTCVVDGEDVEETGANTGVFKLSIGVEWSTQTSLSCNPLKLSIETNKRSFTISAKYLDITGSGTYVTRAPSIEVVKQSPVSVELMIADPDVNVDPGAIDRLIANIDYDEDEIEFTSNDVTLYTIQFRKPDGRTLALDGYTGVPVFFETDFNSGVFRVIIPSTGLLEPGKSYTIVVRDGTGGYTATVPIKITPIEIKLDRTVYPVNRDRDVVIRITYIDD